MGNWAVTGAMGADSESEIIQRKLDRDQEQPGIEIVEIIAEIEEIHPGELPSIWRCIDNILDEIFSTPPAPDAQLEVTFNYGGYRITVEQNGRATFAHIG